MCRSGTGTVRGVMRAVVMRGHGGPEQLEVTEVALPEPGSGEVRVRVTASSVNNTDIWTREGRYGTADDPDAIAGWLGVPIECPRVQGADMAGVVEAVGEGVDERLIGRRVLVDPAFYDRDADDADLVGLLGSEADGGFADFVVAETVRCHDVTDSPLSDLQLAALPIAFGTALGMLRRAEVAAGETMVATGASGGVGVALVQLGQALGASVIAVSTADKADVLRELGAAHVVDRSSPDVVGHAVAAAAGDGAEIDVVADVVGGERFGEWIDALRIGGRVVVAGAIAGPVVAVDLRRVYLGQRRIIGSTMHDPATFRQLVELANAGAIHPPIAEVFPLERLADAQVAIRDSSSIGKIVLDHTI